jgi:hypothetical protein
MDGRLFFDLATPNQKTSARPKYYLAASGEKGLLYKSCGLPAVLRNLAPLWRAK